jgi:hypothetical protein
MESTPNKELEVQEIDASLLEKVPEDVAVAIKSSNLDREVGTEITKALGKMFEAANTYQAMANEIVIDDIGDESKMNLSEELRLTVKRDRLKAVEILKSGRADLKKKMAQDIMHDKLLMYSIGMVEARYKPIESALEDKANYKTIKLAELYDQTKATRTSMFVNNELDVPAFDFTSMDDSSFNTLFTGLIEEKKRKEKEELQSKRTYIIREFGEIAPKEKVILDLAALSQEQWDAHVLMYEGFKKDLQEKENERIKQEQLKVQKENELRSLRTKQLSETGFLRNAEGAFVNGDIVMFSGKDIASFSDAQWEFVFKELIDKVNEQKEEQKKKELVEAEKQRKAQLELDVLKKKKELRDKRSNELSPFITFIRDYTKLIESSEAVYQKDLADIKIAARDHYEYENKKRLEKIKQEEAESLRIQQENKLKESGDSTKIDAVVKSLANFMLSETNKYLLVSDEAEAILNELRATIAKALDKALEQSKSL